MPRFVRRHENGNIEIFSFTGVAMVGRSRRNQVSLDDASVSSTHAKVELADGAWTIYDLESRNGTRINDAEIKVGKLKSGDAVRFGKINVSFEMDEAEAPKAAVRSTEPAKVAAAAPAGAGIEMAPAPSAPAGFGHTMAPFASPAAVMKAAAEARVERPSEKAPQPAPKPPDGGMKVRPDQSELKIRVLKEQVRALQNQRLILMSVAAGLALTTVIFLIAFLMQRNRALSAEHGIRPAGEEQR
ncbi:MAG: FHA domain-containing protein [Planctomycetes bacterium]|nr:FHA domain-containing protein [Planctomycetota bacterium]